MDLSVVNVDGTTTTLTNVVSVNFTDDSAATIAALQAKIDKAKVNNEIAMAAQHDVAVDLS